MNTTKKLVLYLGQRQGQTTLGEQIARLVPMGPAITMRETLTIQAVQQLRESDAGARQIIDQALQIEAAGQYPEWPPEIANQLDLGDFLEAVDRWVRRNYTNRLYALHWQDPSTPVPGSQTHLLCLRVEDLAPMSIRLCVNEGLIDVQEIQRQECEHCKQLSIRKEPQPGQSVTNNDRAMKGKTSQAYVFRCALLECWSKRVMESTRGRIALTQAEQWAREEGWSKKKAGWMCPGHTGKK